MESNNEAIYRGNLVLADGMMRDACVVVRDGVIHDITKQASLTPTHDFSDRYISPGFIDLHIHAIARKDTMDGTADAIHHMAKALYRHGVTGFLPTTVTQSMGATEQAIAAVRAVMEASHSTDESCVLGMHLEGPWISPDAKGAQNGDHIAIPTPESVRRLFDAGDGIVRIVTIAPELPGFEDALSECRRRNISASIGHTTASYDTAEWAMDRGVRRVTHCFNAMTGLHHRMPGVVGAALLRDEVWTELIADGHHVHPVVMRLMVKLKGAKGIILISDSMEAADMPEGEGYHIGGLPVTVKDGQARLDNGSLAGSVLTLDVAVQNMVRLCGVPLYDAVRMASLTPAESIGIGQRKGQLDIGYDADFVVLGQDLVPQATFVSGL